MSDPVIKGVKRPSSRPATHSSSSTSSAKSRKLSAKSARPKPIAKSSTAEKAPVRKATNSKAASTAYHNKSDQTTKTKRASQSKTAGTQPRATSKSRTAIQETGKKSSKGPAATPSKNRDAKSSGAAKSHVVTPAPPRQPTRDEAAALRDFERAHKEFVGGRFAEARTLFRTLIEQHAGVAEVTARARTYLAIAEARLHSESALPRDAEALYDRGVIELNRGEYVAAQEMFERALKRDPEAAHIHYGLAATRARLGSIGLALESLERALNLQPTLRVRAQHDQDLAALRNEPEFERLIFAPRP